MLLVVLQCHPGTKASTLKLETHRLSDQERRLNNCKGSGTLGCRHEGSGRGRGLGWVRKGELMDPFFAWATKLGMLGSFLARVHNLQLSSPLRSLTLSAIHLHTISCVLSAVRSLPFAYLLSLSLKIPPLLLSSSPARHYNNHHPHHYHHHPL